MTLFHLRVVRLDVRCIYCKTKTGEAPVPWMCESMCDSCIDEAEPMHVDDIAEHLENIGPIRDFVPRGKKLPVLVPLSHAREHYTCHDCPHRFSCEWAWDEYNTGGDCLAMK